MKKNLDQKFFWTTFFLWIENFFRPNFFLPKMFGQKKCGSKIFFGPKKFVVQKKIGGMGPKLWGLVA